MAVNHADGTLFISVLLYPIAATLGAVHAGAKWSAPLFIPAGLGVGVLVVFASRRLLYAVMGRLLRSTLLQGEHWWREWIIGPPLLLLYLIYPYVVVGLGLYVTLYGSIWAVKAAS